jgi:hypothetical protein
LGHGRNRSQLTLVAIIASVGPMMALVEAPEEDVGRVRSARLGPERPEAVPGRREPYVSHVNLDGPRRVITQPQSIIQHLSLP